MFDPDSLVPLVKMMTGYNSHIRAAFTMASLMAIHAMETSNSLLQRLQNSPGESDWKQLVDLYTPLVRHWLRRYSSSQQDADDVVQEVLSVVIRKLPTLLTIWGFK